MWSSPTERNTAPSETGSSSVVATERARTGSAAHRGPFTTWISILCACDAKNPAGMQLPTEIPVILWIYEWVPWKRTQALNNELSVMPRWNVMSVNFQMRYKKDITGAKSCNWKKLRTYMLLEDVEDDRSLNDKCILLKGIRS